MIKLSIQKKLNAPFGEMTLQFQAEIEQGQFVTIYGKSGVGKTSTLRILAGLFAPDKGEIIVNGSTWLDTKKGINLSPQKRKVGFVFQDYALFPNMTVKENLLFALQKKQDKRIVHDLIEIIELGELQHRKPNTLSGGQQQRIALARALVQRPTLLMLDEPLSALDDEMRSKLQKHILQLHQEYNLTTLLISHDISEIFKMSDQVFVLENGKIIQQGSPIDVFSKKEMNGQFQFTGEVVSIQKQNIDFVIAILIGKDLMKIVVSETQANALTIGEQVQVTSDIFNPVIQKNIG